MGKRPLSKNLAKKRNLTKIDNEYVILYDNEINDNKKKIKLIPKNHFHKLLYLISFAFFIIILVIFPFDEKKEQIEFDEDEQLKNEILLSEKTDYSLPQKKSELKISTYKVKSGDSLSVIARQYGVSIDTICGSNNLRSYDLIHVGKVLKIPNKDGILHKLKKGQNLIAIANKYKVNINKVISSNSFENTDFLSVGAMVFIPDAKPMNIIPGFMWPTFSRVITSGYGWRRHPIFRRRFFHKGLDMRSKYQSIRSTKYGKVTYTGWLGGYGKTVVIAHPNGWKSLYGHLSQIYVKRGQYVKQGQYVARSGNTGNSTGPHLHFELIKKGRHVNPYKHLKRR